MAADLALGPVRLSLMEIVEGLAGEARSPNAIILRELRLPRVLIASLCGAALGLAGLQMQTLFRNPLADPWALGVTAGAQLGVAFVVSAGALVGLDVLSGLGVLRQLGVVAGAALGSLAVMSLLALASTRMSAVSLLVLGLMIGYLSQGLVSVILHFTTQTQGRLFNAWNDGTFANVTWEHFQILAPLLALAIVAAIALRKQLDALLLGERYALSLGLPVATSRRLILGCTLLLAAPTTAYCGPIAFLGLTAPHIARLVTRGSLHAVLMPVSALTGAVLAVTSDLIVNLPWERHFLHLNAVNGLIGAPIVISYLFSRRDLRNLESA